MIDNNPTSSVLDTLTSLVRQIDWPTTEAKRHRAIMRSIAIHTRNRLTRKRKPTVDEMALAHVLDNFIHWSTDPTDEAKIGKLREAFDMFEALL